MKFVFKPISALQIVGSGAVLDGLGNFLFQGYSLEYLVFMFIIGGLLMVFPLLWGRM